MNYLAAKFSLKMLRKNVGSVIIKVEPIEPEEIPRDVQNYIGHPNMVRVLENILGRKIGKPKMGPLKMSKEDVLYVATYHGTHLSPYAETLPEGASIFHYKVTWQPAAK